MQGFKGFHLGPPNLQGWVWAQVVCGIPMSHKLASLISRVKYFGPLHVPKMAEFWFCLVHILIKFNPKLEGVSHCGLEISTSSSGAWTWKSNNKHARTNLETKLHHPRHMLKLNFIYHGPTNLQSLNLGSSLVWGKPMKQVCRFATLKWSKGSDATSTLL